MPPAACPYCHFGVDARGVAECRTCGGALREASPGRWVPLVHHRGTQRVRELEQRIRRVRASLGGQRSMALTVIMPLLLLGAFELALVRLAAWARADGHQDVIFLVAVAAGLVAFAIYMIAEAGWNRLRRDGSRRRALALLRTKHDLARRRTGDAYMRLGAATS